MVQVQVTTGSERLEQQCGLFLASLAKVGKGVYKLKWKVGHHVRVRASTDIDVRHLTQCTMTLSFCLVLKT